VLFVILPFVGFWLGVGYGQRSVHVNPLERAQEEQHPGAVREGVELPNIDQFKRDAVVVASTTLDIDGDGVPEIAFLDEFYSHTIILLSYDQSAREWKRSVLEEYNTSGYVPDSAMLLATDLNQDGKDELFYRESIEGTGGFWVSGLFVWREGRVEKIETRGVAGFPQIIDGYLVTNYHNPVYDNAPQKFAPSFPREAHYYVLEGAELRRVKVAQCPTVQSRSDSFLECATMNLPTGTR